MTARHTGIVLLALIAAGCAAVSVNLPPITEAPTGQHHDGRIVWRDLLTHTPEASRKFYGELFGWEFESPGIDIGIGGGDDYMLIRHNGRLIGGIVDTNSLGRRDNVSQWVTSMSVSDIEAVVARVVTAGGKVMAEPEAIGSRGKMAVVEDATGAVLALIQTRDGDPEELEPEHNGWLWDELWTNDVDKATRFFNEVIGLEYADHDVGDTDRSYRVLKMDDTARAGVLANPFEDVRPVWVNYLRVEDPSMITAQVEGLGGQVLVEPQARAIGGQVALVAGPSGAGVALQTWPLN